VKIYFSPNAEEDFTAILERLAENNPRRLGLSVIGSLLSSISLTTGDVVRSWAIPPIRIYYQRRAAAF